MGLTKQYLRYKYDATCNIVGSQNGAIQSVSKDVFAVVAAENVNFLNVRTGERVGQIEGSTKMVTAIKLSADKHTIAVGYDDGEIRLVRRENGESSGDVELAAKKTIDTVRSAENVMEAVEIMRDNAVNKIDDSKHVAHPLLQSYVGKSIEYFIIDTIGKVKSRVHHSLVENSLEVVKILNQLEQFTVGGLSSIKGLYGFNLMALRTVLRDIQDRTSSKLFTDIGFGH
ncbi:hypothetical protein QR680_014912 [Steinernema hermaphroditum]|uniref:Anaphase-promoting complex subunit 4-like WD40 domain-containing protein n=1 Tax=Steinernema hermaphroditum TaxID=289476 RepID=A0AA39M4U4_9BILA|nr:hypothetical protein QR680_014912 [Steinernema hermaphroditum]